MEAFKGRGRMKTVKGDTPESMAQFQASLAYTEFQDSRGYLGRPSLKRQKINYGVKAGSWKNWGRKKVLLIDHKIQYCTIKSTKQ